MSLKNRIVLKSSIIKKSNKIKIVLSDVDGVLTDGGMYYTKNGDVMKKFHARDGMGVSLLKKKNIPTIIVTKEKTTMVKQWVKRMPVEKLYDGILDKESILKVISKKYSVTTNEIAYIGDDVNDIELLKKIGLSGCPQDAIKEVKEICDYVCVNVGGNAVFREFADMILSNQN
jgi:3-deoxy-D-manno-octulosonate 8-phosphate phosphatase (KDO 8-P phosphatase)